MMTEEQRKYYEKSKREQQKQKLKYILDVYKYIFK